MNRDIEFDAVRFVFENCEKLELSLNDFKKIEIGDATNYYFWTKDNYDKKLHNSETANSIKITIKKEANKVFYPCNDASLKEGQMPIFERIKYDDIVYIDFLNKNEVVRTFFVNYDGEESNINQVDLIKQDGSLKIYIGESDV